MTKQQLETDVAALQQQAATLRTRLTDARAEKAAAQVAIVDGDAKAPARAAAADQKIVALTSAVAEANREIGSRQSAIAAIRRQEAEAAMLAQIAELARRAETTRDELHQAHVDGCAVLSDLVDAVNALLADLTRQRRAALELLENSGLVPDLCAHLGNRAWSPDLSSRTTALHGGIRALNTRLQQEHGTSLDAILTRYDGASGGKLSEADRHHQFPDAGTLGKRIEAVYLESRQAALRSGAPASVVG
jgi:hypothetical protein